MRIQRKTTGFVFRHKCRAMILFGDGSNYPCHFERGDGITGLVTAYVVPRARDDDVTIGVEVFDLDLPGKGATIVAVPYWKVKIED